MPIYEYVCKQCGHHTEMIQKVSDTPLATCETCGGEVYRPISKTSFTLKGGGWYADGYASKPSSDKTSSSSEGSAKSDSTKKDTKKSDSTKSVSSASPKPSSD